MSRRHGYTNIPTEILRTVEAVVRTGSFTKAAEHLGLSQPAISSQMKRIQTLLGGPVFKKMAHGVVPTELGRLVVDHAQRILELNDQLLRLGSASSEEAPHIRIGISGLYVGNFLARQNVRSMENVIVYEDTSQNIAEGLSVGYIDVGCILQTGEMPVHCLHEFEERSCWVRGKDFVLNPGKPLPIVATPGNFFGDVMIRALEDNGVAYRVSVSTNANQTKLTAVEAGLGLTVLPDRLVPPGLVKAREYYLPPLPTIRAFICVRAGFDVAGNHGLIDELVTMFPKQPATRKASLEVIR